MFEEKVMQHFELTIIASVEPNKPWTQSRLDNLERRVQKQLIANSYSYNGGINLRDETHRRRRNGN